MFDVDFDHPAPELICHPELKRYEALVLEKLNSYFLRDHFIIFSSGSTGGDLKGYALSKKSILKNAEAVNSFFSLTNNDTWALSLPVYHVGGLSVLARAHLLKNHVIDARKWNPTHWYELIKKVTITSIVPTQLYDIVKLGLKAPSSLRYLIVGGDYLSSKLKQKAMDLGWPVIRTYGMSEVCSQLASAREPKSDALEILPIHKVKTVDSRLLVKTESPFTLEFTLGEKFKVKTFKELSTDDHYYKTFDRAELSDNVITPLGRLGDDYKVSGHLINMNKLRDTLSGFLIENDLYGQAEITIKDDERKGKKLVLICHNSLDESSFIEMIKQQLNPVQIDEFIFVNEFNRTSLGKLKKD